MVWGLKHTSMNSIYARGILPLYLYEAPVSIGIFGIICYKARLMRVQNLSTIRIAKSYRTVSNEVLCVISGLITINMNIEERAK